jgi:potassium efflux system protein
MKRQHFHIALLGTRYALLLSVLLISSSVLAQNTKESKRLADSMARAFSQRIPIITDSSKSKAFTDSAVQVISEKIPQLAKDEVAKSLEKFKLGKAAIQQREVLENLKKLNQEVKLFLRDGVDTAEINTLLEHTKSSVLIVKEGIFINAGSSHTQRNLSVSLSILIELARNIDRTKVIVDRYTRKLIEFETKADSLSADSSLLAFVPEDSAGLDVFAKKISVIIKEISPIDSALGESIAEMHKIQYNVDLAAFELQSLREEIVIFSNEVSGKALSKEFPYLWEPIKHTRPFGEILHFSRVKMVMGFYYYLNDNLGLVFIILVLTFAVFYFIYSLKKQLILDDKLADNFVGQLVFRKPFLSAVLIALSIFQFFFAFPPFMLSFFIWLISAICLTLIFNGYISKHWMRFWLITVSFFLLASIDNMILHTTRLERNLAAILSLGGICHAGYILLRGRREELREKNIFYFISFLLICELISFFLNMIGRFNLAKTFLIAGFAGIVIAILFLWTLRLLDECLTSALSSFTKPNRKTFFINFKRVGNEVPRFFYIVLVIGWFFLVGRNFYGFRKIYEPITDFLLKERAVGSSTYTIMSLFVFFLILACTVFVSKLVSFFASEPIAAYQKNDQNKDKINLGSWILLIRIAIISVGLFVAFAAAGISLDRITIIFGALGVGIGLGLQGLVNNLVSGLVLSFERPVHVGDLIELNGKICTMKSIGFRSSIVTSIDGSCIIIPNGELLNQRLINWSMGANLQRNTILIGLDYGTDLEKVKTILLEILTEDERILKYPPVNVVFKAFNQSSIDVELVFWPKHISQAFQVKSDLIENINATLKSKGIEIPSPQQEIYIRSFPEIDKPGDTEKKK